ncbi:tRNA glutamyl-Q(34) synthetase GluQRS [Rhodovulum sp. 12E13]|uniref:tRNA glutamyl-Q(34) synthetase GluQRS n=1 Tax=Rhodovulum sp. 12E13 TaxID=2203891 RepID=UPI000E1A1E3E|nr:tRNA glutamyl-Q(34) synthetase GluQRS [Rhodovulum sp. 12E13]RDC71637.1 tRNA glutamyl-Q(34) synthetase GluQRS [Rhodovulum sp. 12E13]
MSSVTRFAPSPTGPLHLGHAFSALTAFARADAAGGVMLLRIEDLDRSRARPEWEALIAEDLAWLGLTWPRPVMRQSERSGAYDDALARLWEAGLLYPCTCSRRDIEAAAGAPQEGAPLLGPDGLIYPGTCRADAAGPVPPGGALRLNMRNAVEDLGQIRFSETGRAPLGTVSVAPETLIEGIGDVVLRRRDGAAAYHLAVVVDDAAQGITEVVRGEDLFEATAIHVVLQHLLGLATPAYHHHRLIRDEHGKRLAKRDDARALSTLRAEGWTPLDVRRAVGL